MQEANLGKVVAVTRNGLGDMYMFSSLAEADLHPIVQYGDVVCDGPESVLRKYTRMEIPDLLRRLGDEEFRSEVLMKAAGSLGWAEAMNRYSGRVWEKMQECASPPPTDPGEIVSRIVRDRKLSLTESRVKEEKRMSTTEQAETTTAEEKAPKEKKEKATPTTIGGFSLASKITMLVDKDGKPYGKDNNPKKAGSKSAVRFEAYGNGGITVEEAYKAGVSSADFAYDVNKGFIKID